jgi:hypothetical protein
VVGPKRLARRVHLVAEQAAAFGQFVKVPTADTLLAAFAGNTGDVLLWAKEHGTRLFGARDAPALTPTLETRIFRDADVSALCHQPAVDPASCTMLNIWRRSAIIKSSPYLKENTTLHRH